MKIDRGWFIGLLSVLMIMAYACEDQSVSTEQSEQQQIEGLQKMKGVGNGWDGSVQHNFRTHLKGENEVPAVETNAQGQAIFKVSNDGTSIHYKLIVANIENVLMAHIHNAPAGENGGVVVWLYPSAPPPQLIEGRTQGILAEGTITADDLVGSLAGQSLDILLEEMKAGRTYVNVHTEQNPGGEVRGQIK
ncbi:CHRD domain-containing protein [Fodinibius salsisoli]|uniref:CHRD domain-containing protein n=1 Tax=Fodinibius salsisoli TaxID=2820877 RepID=A0ABT3PS42_9BACT|nr:CHRD domain-containing protein [Fodinibius salsisoli]MCW9708684.1 CHRD domain-containing protein [Fodinibius salsisoli]